MPTSVVSRDELVPPTTPKWGGWSGAVLTPLVLRSAHPAWSRSVSPETYMTLAPAERRPAPLF
jgi:hypothetical protein